MKVWTILLHLTITIIGRSKQNILFPLPGYQSLIIPPSAIYTLGPDNPYYARHFFTSLPQSVNEKSPGAVSPPNIGSTTYSSDCNDLETLINKERKSYGLRSLGCDKGMRYVAYKHVTNQIDNSFQTGTCNLHSWAGDLSCCFTSDFRNNKCMWDKPKELYGDTRQGYEISAWTSGGMTAKGALAQWRSSPGHYDVILTQSIWGFLTDFGCWWKGNYAHCWFTK